MALGVRECSHCGGDFHPRSGNAKYCDECRPIVRAGHKQNYEQNHRPERNAAKSQAYYADLVGARFKGRAKQLMFEYGLTYDDVERMIAEQEGNCLACGKPLGGQGRDKDSWAVDHDHRVTDRRKSVRGILHRGCNSALGVFGDTAEGLAKAFSYLVAYERRNGLR